MVEVNKERMLAEFKEIVAIPCHTLQEKPVFDYLKAKLEAMGFAVEEDDAGKQLGGNCGNLWAFLPGNKPGATAVLLSAHMDGVEPCGGTTVVQKDGVLYSDGTTILGGDDKSGVEGILEGLRMLLASGEEHGDIQVLFTIAEEGGVNGSRCMDRTRLRADVGYALDGEGAPGEIVVGAPGQYKYKISVHGKKAHGGLEPEKGINAIMIAAKALADVKRYGRIDEETTANIGIIGGGVATNVVPDLVVIEGDARSRNNEKLAAIRDEIVNTIVTSAQKYGAQAEAKVDHKYSSFLVDKDSKVVALAERSCAICGFAPNVTLTGGGSDANFINEAGVPCVILGTGMANVHTVEEFLKEEDLYNTALMVYGILLAAAE
ncbi:M20/M25/M40 family metallo-hydrolase [uncultured Phascolarctobacterium sp.]|uniref:M20/M25/M40 family metallo-hydrolase n=1 Tax=uncultured Phascolarctobacterium sp. TaxID=512296 RepID=UPI00262B1AB9|nr:M20/M25/M40 family metallo-hydrolase [uncultured Phascolarctobacterium sp.]